MKNKSLLLCVLLFSAVSSSLFATSELMDRGVMYYLRGDYPSAISDFERLLETEDNTRARRLLYNSLVEEGKRHFERERYSSALEYFNKALGVDPSGSEAEEHIQKTKAEIKPAAPQQHPAPARDPGLERARSDLASQRSANTSLRNQISGLTSQRDKLQQELDQFKASLEESAALIGRLEEKSGKTGNMLLFGASGAALLFLMVGMFVALSLKKLHSATSGSQYQLEDLEEKITARLKEAEGQSGELEERVARSINKMIDGQREAVKQVSFSASGQAKKDIEEIKDRLDHQFEENQNRLLELLNLQAQALSGEKSEKVELKGVDGRTVITDVNPHIRARADGVEMIPRTISDPNIAEKMLRPYLSDPNNRVRGNACVAIHQYNPESALTALKKMAENSDKWMRTSAAWAAGEIGTPAVVPVLRKLLDDIDEKVRDRTMKAFENMAELKEDVGAEIRRMIEEQRRKGGG